jgi:Cu(I)/Ag(I) efflux system membrane fusion protein
MKIINNLVIYSLTVSVVGLGGYYMGSKRVDVSNSKAEPVKTESRKLLYYRNPMGLADTSPVPKKDSMGMDYVAVYQGDEEDGRVIALSVDRVQKLGVKSEAAQMRVLKKSLRAVGRIEVDERRTYTVAPKFEGWVEKLHVNSTGQFVKRGEVLFDVYSPELVSAQREYALARHGEAALSEAGADARAGMKQLADASLSRLKNWDMPVSEQRVQTFAAPVTGVVLEKKAVQGMRFQAGDALYQIADLSIVWLIADVAAQDIGQVSVGTRAEVSSESYPDKHFSGKVSFIYPTINAETRTVPVRVELANPQGQLKPSMFANVALDSVAGRAVLTVPTSAVIDSGTRQVVLVRLSEGRFEPRLIKPGARSDEYVEVLAGIADGEQVVTSANFLIDAESNLKAALGGMKQAAAPEAAPVARTVVAVVEKPVVKPVQEKVAVKVAPEKVLGHQASGVFNAINGDGTVSITHGPIATLGWPGMTMDFTLANSSLAASIKPGSKISFEIVERAPDEWVIIKLKAQ